MKMQEGKPNNLVEINIDNIIEQLLSVRGSKPGQLVNLSPEEIQFLYVSATDIIKTQPAFLELEAPIKIVGDIHGQYYDLLRTFEYGGYPPAVNYLFLGNYVDFGNQSIETICLLLAYKVKYPENFFLLRGNHECAMANRIHGFYDEVNRRYHMKFWRFFVHCFNLLPFAAIVDDSIFCCHSGLSPDLLSIEQIKNIPRPTDIPDEGLLCDLMYAVPDSEIGGWGAKDGEHFIIPVFGEDVVSEFLHSNKFDLMVRSNQYVEDGYQFSSNRKLVTIFSAPNFKGAHDNASAIMVVDADLKTSFQILKPAERKPKELNNPIPAKKESVILQKASWNRSSIKLIGQGRAGKTALANNIMGKRFQPTDSTIGIQKFERHVIQGKVDTSGKLLEFHPPEKEFEALLALETRAIRQGKRGTTSSELEPEDAENDPAEYEEPGEATFVEVEGLKLNKKKKKKLRVLTTNDVNEELFNKCLSENISDEESKLIISLYDFGGQDVFNVLHPFFLSKYSIYFLVFDMELLLSSNANNQASCLKNLRFWMNSIAMHTYDEKKNKTADIVLVGTRKDKINKITDHEKISHLLATNFDQNLIWSSLIRYKWTGKKSIFASKEEILLSFFPVDNKKNGSNETVASLLQQSQSVIINSDFVKKEIPLIWLKLLDVIKEISNKKKSSFLLFSEIEAIAISINMEVDTLPEMLRFLYDMGFLIWIEENDLRDIVILDPIEYFVKPTTMIICQHVENIDDPYLTKHETNIHLNAKNTYKEDWMKMLEFGIVTERLAKAIWQDYDADHIGKIISLMKRYGLMIPINGQKSWLIPAQFPDPPHLLDTQNAKKDSSFQSFLRKLERKYELVQRSLPSFTFHFLFYLDAIPFNSKIIQENAIRQYGFLPIGLYERFIAHFIQHIAESSVNFQHVLEFNQFIAFKDAILVQYAGVKLKISQLSDLSMISIHVIEDELCGDKKLKKDFVRLHDSLMLLLQKAMKECFGRLQVLTIFPFHDDPHDDGKVNGQRTNPSSLFVPLNTIRELFIDDSVTERTIISDDGNHMVTVKKSEYLSWIPPAVTTITTTAPASRNHHSPNIAYDIFISYRWGPFDSEFVIMLYNFFQENHMKSFLDQQCLSLGQNFRQEFIFNLLQSTIILPVVSLNALKKLITHDPSFVDNLLLEWIIALHCYFTTANHSSSSSSEAVGHVKAIIPLILGEISLTTATGNNNHKEILSDLFIHSDYQFLLKSEIIPEATIKKAEEMLLQQHSMKLSLPISSPFTIGSFLQLFFEQLGINCASFNNFDENQFINIRSAILQQGGKKIVEQWNSLTSKYL